MTASAVMMLLCGCTVFDTEVQRGYASNHGWTTGAAFTTADVRIVTQRIHPLLGNPIVCTEPSPDVAKALSTAAGLTAQGGNGAATGSLGVSGASAEAVAELAGRSTALMGLRDSLYRACEAYANGVIGQNAYALVLSRYGQLMTTLFLGQDITGAAGAEGHASISSPQPANQPSSSGKTSTTTTTTSPASAKADTTGPNAPGIPQLLLAAAGFDLAQAAPAPAPALAPAQAPAPSDSTGKGTTPSTDTAAAAALTAARAALTLGRMNEDYFSLDDNPVHLLMVACITENDPTRLRPPGYAQNTWLEPICRQLEDLRTIVNLERLSLTASAAAHPSIKPEVAAIQPSSTTANVKPAANAPIPDPTVVAVQKALQTQSCVGCFPGQADGIPGNQTTAAVKAYQRAEGLTVNGNPKDPATMEKLGVKPANAGGAPAPVVPGKNI